MLFAKAHEREQKEAAEALERLTLGVNNGIAISSSSAARRQFENARETRATPDEPGQTVSEYRATMARLAARFPANVQVN